MAKYGADDCRSKSRPKIAPNLKCCMTSQAHYQKGTIFTGENRKERRKQASLKRRGITESPADKPDK